MSIEIQLDLCLRLAVSALLCGIVGYNREANRQPAGLRTHILVGIGSTLFTGLSLFAFGSTGQDRVAAQIVTGIGFLGAGTIIRTNTRNVHGMTTAAGIWATAAIGMACGAGFYILAAFTAILIWFVLAILRRLDNPDQDKGA